MSRSEQRNFKVKNIPIPRVPILGFTGALGSGCTFFAERVALSKRYLHVSLSALLHEELRRRGIEERFEALQDLGNELRRQNGQTHLAFEAFKKADSQFQEDKHEGVVLDGFRHPDEVSFMSQLPNFYLFSIQANEELRKERLASRCPAKDFERTAKRDSDERDVYGQHVSTCNELSDIVIQNCIQQPTNDRVKLDEYVREKTSRYLTHIDLLISQGRTYDSKPNLDEVMMAAAYAVSKRSQCLKRSVGAVVCDAYGEIIASGFNTVPNGLTSCLDLPGDSWCHRDACLNAAGQVIRHCPGCGTEIHLKNQCKMCGRDIDKFSRFCPSCKYELQWDYKCENCELQVFKTFLPKMLEVCRSLHAEEMALLNLGKDLARIYTSASIPRTLGDPARRELRLYVTTYPCNLCANKIVESGVTHVIYSESYESRDSRSILEKGGVIVIPFEGVKSTAYFKLYK